MPWWDDFPRLNVDNKRYGLLSEKEGEEGKKKTKTDLLFILIAAATFQPILRTDSVPWKCQRVSMATRAASWWWRSRNQVECILVQTSTASPGELDGWLPTSAAQREEVTCRDAQSKAIRTEPVRTRDPTIWQKKKRVTQMAISQAARKTVALSHATSQRIKKKNKKKNLCHDKNKETNKQKNESLLQLSSFFWAKTGVRMRFSPTALAPNVCSWPSAKDSGRRGWRASLPLLERIVGQQGLSAGVPTHLVAAV